MHCRKALQLGSIDLTCLSTKGYATPNNPEEIADLSCILPWVFPFCARLGEVSGRWRGEIYRSEYVRLKMAWTGKGLIAFLLPCEILTVALY